MPNICNFENCRKRAYSGYTYGSFERCKEHKEDRPNALQICKCGKAIPTYNEPGEKIAIYCASCKTKTMVSLKNKLCNCGKRPTFNEPGKKTPICCASCKTKTMVNVTYKLCKCGKRPTFNEPGEISGICCASCKTKTMVNVVDKMCKCGKAHPTFNEPGEKIALCCVSCKTSTMIDVKSKLCNCGKRPSYNEPGEETAICCLSCKTSTMINVKNKKCKCGKARPYFNEPGEKNALCCASCKTSTMIDVLNKKCKCGKAQPIFNEPEEKTGLCCFSCKTDTMVNVVDKLCKGDACINMNTRANPKYKGYCANCFTHLFPNDPLTFQTNCKTKELAVRDYINMNFEGFICDRQLTTANCDCTIRRRPDLRILINETLLCIEIDENQHKSYSEMDEETRYNDLYMAYSGKWIYIRFNPDKFKKNNKNVNPTIANRLPILKKEIEKQFKRIENNENRELVERIYLYFDE